MGRTSRRPLSTGLRPPCVLPRPREVGPHAQASPYWTPLPLGLVDRLSGAAPSLHVLGLCLRLASLVLAAATGEPIPVSVRRLVAALGCSRQTARQVRCLVEAATDGWAWTDPGRTGAAWTVLPAAWSPADGRGAGEPWAKTPTDCHLPARLIAAMALLARTDRGRSRRSWQDLYYRSGARMVCSLRSWQDTVREARRLGLVGRTRGYVLLRWSRLSACPRLRGVAPDPHPSRARPNSPPKELPDPPTQALTGEHRTLPRRVLQEPEHACPLSGPPSLYPCRLKGPRGAGEMGAWAEACADCLPPSGARAWLTPDRSPSTDGWWVVVGEPVWWGRDGRGCLVRLNPDPPGVVEARRLRAAALEAWAPLCPDPEPPRSPPDPMPAAKERAKARLRQWAKDLLAAGEPPPSAACVRSTYWVLVETERVAAEEGFRPGLKSNLLGLRPPVTGRGE